jgi:hypothetical protein
MTRDARERLLRSYSAEWRVANGDVLMGMLENSHEQRPEMAREEAILAHVHGLYSRVRWVIPFALSISAIVITGLALVVLGTVFTDTTAPLVRVALFGLVPAFSLLAVVTAMAASRRVLRAPWAAATLGLISIAIACAAHVTWYARVDGVGDDRVPVLWIALIVSAIACTAAVPATLLIPGLLRARMPAALAVTLGIVVGVVGGAILVGFLAIPAGSIAASLIALAIVIALYKADRRAILKKAPTVAAASGQ